MAANSGTDIIDHNLTIEVWELFLNQISNCTGIIIAGGHGDKALAIVIMAALGVVLHFLYDLLDDSLLPRIFWRGMRWPSSSIFSSGQIFSAVPNQPAALEMRPPRT